MHVRRVDPRDQTSAIEDPVYRVYFWQRPAVEQGESTTGRLYTSSEYELTDCRNVREAIAWAEENRGPSRTYTLYVAAPLEGLTLIRLFGVDPTRRGSEEPALD